MNLKQHLRLLDQNKNIDHKLHNNNLMILKISIFYIHNIVQLLDVI